MADDELILNIDKALWPKGVMRGLTTVLRQLGDRHGNLVIVAQPLKGTIMVKGPADNIEGVKPELREVIEEHFPDAETPEELLAEGGGGAAAAEAEVDVAMEAQAVPEPAAVEEVPPVVPPTAAAPSPPPAPAKPRATKPAAAGALKLARPVAGRRPRVPMMAPPDLLWECIKGSSSFIRRPTRELPRAFSAEPANLMGLHTRKYSGLVADEALDIRPAKRGVKEAIQLIQSPAKAERRFCPASSTITMGLSKCPKRGLSQLDVELAGKFYRHDLHGLARAKYLRVQQSFKKKRRVIKPRRAQK